MVIHFDFAASPTQSPTLTIGNHSLDVVHAAKILGITHSWDQHVSTIVTSASFRLYMLRHLKTLGVPPSELITIYKTFILPRLTYASPDWSFSLDAAQLLRLEKVQKRAMKIILGSSYNCYEDALTTLGLTTLSALYQKMLLQFGEKTLNNPRHRHLPAPALPPRHTQQAVPEGLGRTDMRIALCQIWVDSLMKISSCLNFPLVNKTGVLSYHCFIVIFQL